jgi:hypothetical protein
MTNDDPLAWDRQVRLLAEFDELYRIRLNQDPMEADPSGPFIGVPPITERTAFAELQSFPGELPIRHPLERWFYRLADARVNAPFVRRIACFWRSDRVETESLKETNLTRADLLRRVLRDGPARHQSWSELEKSLDAEGPSPSELWQRRDELAKRAGFENLENVLDPVEGTRELVEQWQERSAPITGDVLPREALASLSVGMSMEASRGWPVHISAPSMARLLGEKTWMSLAPVKEPRWPELLGPSSFMRALYHLGGSLAGAWAPESCAFVLSHDPWKLESHRLGALVSSLALNESWHFRVLGSNKDQARLQVRALARSVLLESRWLCLKVGLRAAAVESRNALNSAFAELSYRCLGFELPTSLAGYVPRLGRSDAQRLLGLWLGIADQMSLIQTFDEDWYRNPRAIETLRGQALERPSLQLEKAQVSEAQVATLRWLSSNLDCA